MSHKGSEVKNFALIGAGPVGIFLSHLLIDKGHKVTLYEAGGIDSESTNLNLEKYIFKTKSKIPSGVHRVGGASNLWKRRVSEFSPHVFNRKDDQGNRVWPLDFNALEEANEILFKFLGKSGLRDKEYKEKYLDDIYKDLPHPFEINLFRFSEENFFINLLTDLESNENFNLVTNTLVTEILLPCQSEIKLNRVELVLVEANVKQSRRVFHSDVVLTGGCLQSTALAMKSPDLLNRLSAPNIIGKYLMEHFDGYVGTLRMKSTDDPYLKKFLLDDSRRLPGREFGVGIKLPDATNRRREEIAFHLELVDWRKTYLFDPNLNIFNGLHSGIYEKLFLVERLIKKFPSEVRKLWFKANLTEIYSVWLKGEELPCSNSILQIAPDRKTGELKLVYNHRVSNESKNLIRMRLEEFSRILKKKQLGKFKIHLYFRLNRLFYTGPNFHPMGSLRMGSNPNNSIVNSKFSFHGSPHVFAVNSGIFPNGSNHNPTAMVLALSIIFASSQ